MKDDLPKAMLFLVKHSRTADGDETMTTCCEPNQREKTRLCFWDRQRKVRGLWLSRDGDGLGWGKKKGLVGGLSNAIVLF